MNSNRRNWTLYDVSALWIINGTYRYIWTYQERGRTEWKNVESLKLTEGEKKKQLTASFCYQSEDKLCQLISEMKANHDADTF